MARAYDSGLFELEAEAGGIWGTGLGYAEQAGYSPLGYSQTPLDRLWFGQPQAEANSRKSAKSGKPPLPPLPPLDPRPFGDNAQLQADAQQLAQLRGSRVVKAEVERLYRAALQAAERAARRARSNVAAARAAVARPDPAQVQARVTSDYEAWLAEDYRLTMEGARARYGKNWQAKMSVLVDPAKQQAFYDNQLAQCSRAWLISRREQLDFQTLGAPNLRSLKNFQPPTSQVGLVVSPLIPGSEEEPVAPIVVTFVQELKKRYRGFTANTYPRHGLGVFLRRGYSIDFYLDSSNDDRGFYPRATAEAFLRQIHETARAVNVEWRVLYNDFSVADAINRATGVRHVFFIGSPFTVQRGGTKYGTNLNWHGPAPLILHFHLDLVPLATTSGSQEAESGRLGFQDPQVCQRLEAEYCFMASRLRSLPREIANKKDDLQRAEYWLNRWRCQNWPGGVRQPQTVAKKCQEQAARVERIRNEITKLETEKADLDQKVPNAWRAFRFSCPNQSTRC